ncbi:3-deoxy-D-manno-octulosonic acid transferase [Silicimonas algicola]|uniref:3-deoxy-D-manno-octulosonic acid transferase n=1 Tax=Silicimonas algicola TaxID=1826607 RepID=A0A316GEH9_9RHOB|nr:glycosyltransferase N-terminal domain-containing protein [Silicimonas algicola]AZQ66310.1 3-deoxy-D-manno-octulosonic acid transferase [Silicimonas algicola]PWK58635.1 3-deoxy-D-manno-octulosonic-acid transferase [Silicimonas algicola]
MSPLLSLYLGFSRVSGPLWRWSRRRRVARGKEVAERLPEKFGTYATPRPEGTVLWFHALSVGESLALVPLIERALDDLPDAHVVLTTSTATSATALAAARLPERAIHVLSPVDTVAATRAFLDHWRPDVAAFAELDFWPRLMVETKARGIPMILVNSRMPDGSFARRKRIAGPMRDVLRLFDRLLVQDEASVGRFAALGADPDRIEVAGALKAAARPLPADEGELAQLASAFGDRPRWLGAATHGTEHAAMIEAHGTVTKDEPRALLVLAPRHLRDADEAETLARTRFNVARRSRGEAIGAETQVYLADTIGEMGLWYRLCPVSFVGHSLLPDLEGKNPYEAAALGSAILHGPHMSYFAESYEALTAEGAAACVTDEDDLAKAVLRLQDEATRAGMSEGARRVIAARGAVLDRTWAAIRLLLS